MNYKFTKTQNTKNTMSDRIKVDNTLDTSKNEYLITLKYKSDELVRVFGMPLYVDNKYEWKLKVYGHIYSMNNTCVTHKFENMIWDLRGLKVSPERFKESQDLIDDGILTVSEVEDLIKQEFQDEFDFNIVMLNKYIKNNSSIIKIDTSLDTSKIRYLKTLNYRGSYLDLRLNQPQITKKNKKIIKYEWKLSVNGNIYSIYNPDNSTKFDEIIWHIGGVKNYTNGTENDYKEIENDLNEIERFLDDT